MKWPRERRRGPWRGHSNNRGGDGRNLGVNESRKSGGKIRIRDHRVLCFRKEEKEVTPPPSATPNNPWQSLRTPNNHACC